MEPVTQQIKFKAHCIAKQTALALVHLVVFGLFVGRSDAASLRCPTATAGGSFPEAAEITALWKGLSMSGLDGSDGPMGCPLAVKAISDSATGWSGVQQRFQRGTILIGNGASSGMEVAAVRGLGGWFVWWKAPGKASEAQFEPSKGPPSALGASNAFIAHWSFGGFVMTVASTDMVALWRCSGSPCSWARITPMLDMPMIDGLSRPFDAAAKLDRFALAQPDPARSNDRLNALLPDWLPCYTAINADSASPGEGTISRAILMMRGSAECPLTGQTPTWVVDQWLSRFSFPSDQLPGTDTDDFPCTRYGDLDVMLVPLLHLVLQHQAQFSAATLSNVRNLVAPWGGSPRTDAYATPNGTCAGYSMIETENHILMQETARYLSNFLRGQDTSSNRDWLLRFLQQLVRRDFYEFNSLPYTRYHLKPLYALHDYAPDSALRTAARGVIDWIFAKESVAENMDRDHRPFRRQPDPKRYANTFWWGSATTASTAQTSVFAGPLQHIHTDIDLELNDGLDENKDDVFADPNGYPALGSGEESFAAEFADISDTGYTLPAPLGSWLGSRYMDNANNRVSYIQEIHHSSTIANDPNLFLQTNQGVELMSGNRNWTINAGGNAVPPGALPDPPRGAGWTAALIIGGAAIGTLIAAAIAVGFSFGPLGVVVSLVVGLILGSVLAPTIADKIARDNQTKSLWKDQPGILRETTLIPSAVGLDRSQTIRFGQPLVNTENASIWPRLCVAEGFLCGFDLIMPNRPFSEDSQPCPLALTMMPPAAAYIAMDDGGVSIATELGCLVMPSGDSRGWTMWTFERGMVVEGTNDPPGQERIGVVWIHDDGKGSRVLHQRWRLGGQYHDFYNVHAYNRDVVAGSGYAPGGDIRSADSGDPNNMNTWDKGEVSFVLKDVNDPAKDVQDSTWSILTEACDPEYTWYGYLGFRTSYTCHADVLPKLTITVAEPAAQPFSCKAYDFRGQGLVMETGESCTSSPYGMFTYTWVRPCTDRCPPGANNYGFVVVAPSRGWTSSSDFAAKVELSIAAFKVAAGHEYLPIFPNTIDVPISPPVRGVPQPDGKTKWVPVGPPGVHTVTFRFTGDTLDQGNILGDTGAPDIFGPLLGNPEQWPTARGHVLTPDLPSVGPTELLHSAGTGCFTMRGIASLSAADPPGLLVDLRNTSAPIVEELISSKLAAACP